MEESESEMNPEIQKKLLELLEKTTDFAMIRGTALAEHILQYNFYRYLCISLFSILLFAPAIFFHFKLKTDKRITCEKCDSFHFLDLQLAFYVCLTAAIVFFVSFEFNAIDGMLKIKFAPELFLLEQIQSLIHP